MAEVIRMPLLSDTMTEGTIVAWNKNVGDEVEAGDVLAEVETDKAVMEVESYFDGVLLYIGVEAGNAVPIDAIIAIIGEAGEEYQAILDQEGADGQNNEKATETAEPEKESTSAAPTETPATPSNESDKRIKASPLAKKMAEENSINLSAITGTGDGGRIIKRDIEAFLAREPEVPTPPVVSTPAAPQTPAPAKDAAPEAPKVAAFTASIGESYDEVPLSNMRKTIARRLGESKFTAPHFYLTVDINMDKAITIRKQLNEISPVKISFNDIVVKSAAAALKQHPAVNSYWMGDKIHVNHHVSVGVAVAVDEGLLVPVIKHTDLKSLSQISAEVRELAGKARNRKLGAEEMSGNTFTISNLGMFGIEEFTAIINPPASCIMAVGGIRQEPVVEDGEIKVGNRMKVTMSCDHRVVDGATGAQFLATFKSIMEDPVRMLV
ncbi:MAG: pyruvate dehydrogenase complex dihydrolipoamide acetyltransferase [Bacteroidota bacterium]